MNIDERQARLLKLTSIDFRSTEQFVEEPFIVSRAEGLYYWDTEGKRYFDAIGGIFAASLGHGHPRVLEAMRRQMEQLSFAPPMHGIADVTLDFVERLGSVTPENLNFVKPFSGGSESIEAAMKFTRQYFKQTGQPEKYKFVSRYQGYHGGTFGAMAASGTGKRKTPFEPQMGGFLKVFSPTYYRDRFSCWEECNRFCARMFEDVILSEDPRTVAGVIVEPIGNTGGTVTPTDESFQILRQICDDYEVLLIFDEIITGYGRTGNMFAAQTFGVTPDILCGGKGLSSGAVPLGAMIARENLGDAFYGSEAEDVNFAHGHTFAGNPLASAVGIAVIDEIVDNDLAQGAQELGVYLVDKLRGLEKYGVVREIRGKGLLRGVELMREGEPCPELGVALKKTALDNGLVMRIDPLWFAVAPALIVGKDDIDELYGLVEQSVTDALAVLD